MLIGTDPPRHNAMRKRFNDAFLPRAVTQLESSGRRIVSEVFDADPPFTPRGCVAQAWSVAEVLRVWVKLAKRAQRPKHESSTLVTSST